MLTEESTKAENQNGSTILRNLGAFEEIYWLFNQSGPRAIVMAMVLEAPTTVSQWRAALDAVQAVHPLLSAVIKSSEHGVPYFQRVANLNLPLRVVASNETTIEEQIGQEVVTPISAEFGPLARAVLLHSAESSSLILTAHHSISDGTSLNEVLRQVAQVLAGQILSPQPLLPSQEEALGATLESAMHLFSQGVPQLPPPGPPVKLVPRVEVPFVRTLKLSSCETHAIVKEARANGTTVHGALCAALTIVGRNAQLGWEKKPVRIISTINPREAAEVGSSLAMYVEVAVVASEAEDEADFWSIARSFTDRLAAPRSKEGLQFAANLMTMAVQRRMNAEEGSQFLCETVPFEAFISNLGRQPDIELPAGWNLRSIWGPSFLTGVEDEHVLGANTLRGEMHLVYTTYKDSDLLTKLRNALVQVSGAQL